MTFSTAEWAELSKYLEQGLDVPPAGQSDWIDSLSALSPHLKSALREMLERDQDRDANPLLHTLPKLTGTSFTATDGLSQAGRSIGRYRLIRELGRGGMGTVWLADRADGDLTRQVALKLPHAIHDTQFQERFRRERDILATFTHPNIAQIYDAGVTQEGQPFIALEYVEGSSLLQYCDQRNLSVRERLSIFLQVLSAVHYAHSHLVIHRDLKPANIMLGQGGDVKLLDFGIAKLMTGGRALTLDYAAPEQVLGKPVSTASDVYSLGVVLCELLAGSRPYSLKRSFAATPEEALQTLQIARPSQLAKDDQAAQARGTTPKKLTSLLSGDLDTIVLKALQPEPVERYASADAFAQDVRRYLQGEAVLAQPERWSYRAKKFVLRHKVPLAAVFVAVLALAVGLGAALWQARVARQEAHTAQAVQTFLEDIFKANSANQTDPAKARQTTARQLLDIGTGKIQNSLKDAPEARLRVLQTLGQMYLDLGVDDQAVALNKERLALVRSIYGNRSREAADALISLGFSMHSSGSVNERPAVLNEAKELLDQRGDFTSATRGTLLRALAEQYQSTDTAKALDFAHQSVAVSRRSGTPDELIQDLSVEGRLHNTKFEFNQALPLFSEAISLSKKNAGDPNADLPQLYFYQGEANQNLLRLRQAEQSYRDAYSAAQKLNGQDHVDTIETEMGLAILLMDFAKSQEGLQYLETAKNSVLKIRGPADPFFTPQVLFEYGRALAKVGRMEDGLVYVMQAIENRRKNRPGTLFLAKTIETEASIRTDLGEYVRARMLLDEAVAIRGNGEDEAARYNVAARVKLLLATGNPGEAAQLIQRTYDKWPKLEKLSDIELRIRKDKAALALAQGQPSTALSITQHTLQQIAASPERNYLRISESDLELFEGEAELMLKRPTEALLLLNAALRLRTEFMDAKSPALAEVMLSLAACNIELGNRGKASELSDQARTILAAHPKIGGHYKTR
jgi:serine/threonine-protein kinase